MALVVKDRVKETSTTTGTSDFALSGAATGFQTFSVIGDGNTTYYAAVDSATGDWEVGVGTYSSAGPTLSRDTVFESSNAGSKVSFSAGSKEIFVTYPAERAVYLSAAGSAVDVLDIGTLGTSTANITTANITSGTVSTTPTSANDLANKAYVDTMVSSGITYHAPVRVEAPTNLNATYNNGTAGVGATLTNAGTQAALVIDGVAVSVNDRVLVYQQTTQTQNGIYTVTDVGSGSTNWVLTRATDADSYGVKDPNSLGEGDAFFVQQGDTGAGETYVCNTVGTITFGTTNIAFTQVSSVQVYSAGTGLTLSGTQFSITPVGTAATYGSASQVPVFTTNSTGQVTSVTSTSISIGAGAVSGLAASATTDTTNAANISSGTLNSARLTGSYTGITGVGTLTAGTWNGSVIGPAYGGTGFGSYTTGDLLYADSASSLAKLAGVATGNALISGGVGTAPAWGKIGLQTHVDGTLQVSNGGTGATTLTGYVYGNGTGAFTASTSIPNSATTATSANTANAIVARDASGNFSAGTITASLNGNASTATTAANVNNGTLSLGVSGTGLSGSATFTANQSGNSTFTVTSNATSANTASTIVARDGSGNFSAGTITASLSGNASSASQVNNAVTFNNGGSGGASGSSYNGSGALTVSYNTIGAPSTTGTNASGTWGINVTGNSATTSQRSFSGDISTTGQGRFTGWYTGNAATGIAAEIGMSGGQGYIFVYNRDTSTYGTLNIAAGAANMQFSGSTINVNSGALQQGGNQVLHAGNYNSYAPTLTGGGASGTWGINITGNAATAGTASNSSALNGLSSTQLFNNMGQNHNTYTDANAFTNFGTQYLQGGTNGPGNGASQWYMFGLGLGNEYSYSQYAMQFAVPRTPLGGNPYVSIRFREAGTWGSWAKIWAGYADSAGNAATITNQANSATITASTGVNGNHIVQRDGNGYIYANHINFNTSESENPTINSFITSNGDGWSRKSSLSHAMGQIRGVANGTWGINVTGNAATATNASYAYNYTQGFNSNWNTDFQAAPAGSMILRGDTSSGSSTGGPGGTWWFQQNYRHTNSSNFWGVQIAWGWEDNANRLATRNVTGGSFGGWVYYLNSANYNSYAPTLTGGGASGTWGINITGNAGSASSVAWTNVSGRPTNVSSFTNDSGYVTTAGARSALSFTAGSGAYNSSTGVITIPTNTNQLTNGAGFTTNTGTVTSVSGTGSVSGITLSGTVTSSGSLTLGGTLSVAALSTASGSAPSYSARAWVNFNGTGTVAIRSSGNVTSISDNGTGDYTINFTTAMQDTNYACVLTTTADSVDRRYLAVSKLNGRATGSIGIWVSTTGNALVDLDYVAASVFR